MGPDDVKIRVWVKIKDLGDQRFKFIFSISHPITGVLNFVPIPISLFEKMMVMGFRGTIFDKYKIGKHANVSDRVPDFLGNIRITFTD